MSIPPVSARTLVRDAVIATFEQRKGDDGVRVKAYDVSPNFLTVEECKRWPTYCVIVTDEAPSEFTQRQVDCTMTLTIVIYVKDDRDVRAALDAAIEDVYDTMLLAVARIGEAAWQLTLTELTTDDGTTIAKPHAQAIQRWHCHHGRATTAA